MVRDSKQRRVIIPYGGPNNITVYINEVLYDGIFNFNVQKYLDNVWIFDAIVPGSNKTDSNLLRGNTVKIFIANNIFLKGTIESSKYKTANTVAIKGVGSVAYKLRAKTVTQNEENKSFYNAKTSEYVTDHLCSTNLDGVTPWEVTTNHGDVYPSIFVRMDNENRLAGVMGTAKACNYNWYESWGEFPWNDNVMNMANHKGSESSTYTFEISGDSQNTINSEREENREKLYNDITVLGYGDGVNQLKTKIFHATDNRTYLTVAMTKDGTETITVANTTSFDATGDLWIGCEKVSYTGKTGTTFTGITRSVAFADKTDVVESYLHTKYIEVYDAQYTRTSAETDSSIGDGTELNNANWGINEQTFTDKTIIDQDTLDKIAYYLLLQHKDIVISITLNPMEIYDTMSSVELGDVVTINDTDLGVTGAEYRIIGIELGRDNAVPYITIKCSTSYMNITDIISRMESESKSLSSYMQGSPSVVSVQSYENAQYSATPEDKAMKMKFRVWDKTIAITDARLDFKILPFRAYADASHTSTGGSAHNHSLTGVTSSINTEAGDDDYNSSGISSSTLTTATSWYSLMTYTRSSTDQTNQFFTASIRCKDVGKDQIYWFKVVNITDSTTYPDSSIFPTVTLQGTDSIATISINTFSNNDGDQLQLLIAAQTYDDTDIEWNATRQAAGVHEHGFTGESTVNESSHTHTITTAHGIFEDSDNSTVKVQIGDDDDWTATKAYINSGSAYSYGTHNNVDISTELKSLMGDLSSTKRIRVQFEPQGAGNTCRIEANVDLFTFLGST